MKENITPLKRYNSSISRLMELLGCSKKPDLVLNRKLGGQWDRYNDKYTRSVESDIIKIWNVREESFNKTNVSTMAISWIKEFDVMKFSYKRSDGVIFASSQPVEKFNTMVKIFNKTFAKSELPCYELFRKVIESFNVSNEYEDETKDGILKRIDKYNETINENIEIFNAQRAIIKKCNNEVTKKNVKVDKEIGDLQMEINKLQVKINKIRETKNENTSKIQMKYDIANVTSNESISDRKVSAARNLKEDLVYRSMRACNLSEDDKFEIKER